MIVLENEEYLKKYLVSIEKLPHIKKIVVYNDDIKKLRDKYKQNAHYLIGW